MTEQITCPRCGEENQTENTYCQLCSINLALADLYRQSSGLTGTTATPQVTIAPEVLVPRLGESLIEKGVLTPDKLDEALEYKTRQSEAGRPVLVGQALLALKFVSREALDEVVTEQILMLQDALRQANQQLEQRVKERTRDLQKALDKLKELSRLKSDFLANISHELRTPLAHVMGYAELMADGSLGQINPEQEIGVGVIMRATRRLERLIEDLIQFSIAGQEQYTARLGPMALGSMFRLTFSQCLPKAKSKQIELVQEWPESLPLALADGEKITWAVSQLLDNAVKFTDKGGQIYLGAADRGGEVEIWVKDTGIGFPADRIDEIFEPFHQLDGSSTRRFGGTGLGLALVRRIIESHQTTVMVESQEGQGTTFRFHLPAYPEPEDESNE